MTSDPRPVIGIIGGMGPAAGFDLAGKVTQLTRAGADQDHLPVVVASFPDEIPDRTKYLLQGVGENPGEAIFGVLARLEKAGATVAGMACNTAHAPPIFEQVTSLAAESRSRLRLLNMIDETAAWLASTLDRGCTVGVLATTGTRRLGLYRSPLKDAGFRVAELDDADQEGLVMDALYNDRYGLKAVFPPTSEARSRVREAIDRLRSRGAEAVVLGCTELPLAVPEQRRENCLLVDPTRVLAQALIRESYPDRLREDQTE